MAVIARPVNNLNLVTRAERERAQYIGAQIKETIESDRELSPVQKEALIQTVSEKLNQMVLNRDFYQGIPPRIAIQGNQFNITPPVPLRQVIRNAVAGGFAGVVAFKIATTSPVSASAGLTSAVGAKYVYRELNAGHNPCGLRPVSQRLEAKHPEASKNVKKVSKALFD